MDSPEIEREGATRLGERPLTLVGPELHPGDRAPDATLAGKGFVPEPVSLSAYRGAVLILSTVPSLDTRVCDLETRRWEQELQALEGPIEMLTVSIDLPFAQARWCGAAEVHHTTASAYMSDQFARDYGVLIKENHLLARAVFVVDAEGRLVHVEYVPAIGSEPDYPAALDAARAAAGAAIEDRAQP
ncbi:MAG: thiol peroxidase [Candidatus Dormibacteraeota bacterium]|nr:thiol peroxidase [Candidatus Dormibacteraeota bacterium]